MVGDDAGQGHEHRVRALTADEAHARIETSGMVAERLSSHSGLVTADGEKRMEALEEVRLGLAYSPAEGEDRAEEVSPQKVGLAYDGLAKTYDNFHVDAKSRAENAFIARALARRLTPSTRVVDLGCGTGLLLDLLDIPPERYLGIDISGRMLERAREKHPHHRFELGDMRTYRAAEPFDLVVSLFGSPSYCEVEAFRRTVASLRERSGGVFLMYCGPRYIERSTYINKGLQLLRCYPTLALQRAYPTERVWGMSWLVDRAPARAPAALMRLLLRFDASTAGRYRRDQCFFLIVEG